MPTFSRAARPSMFTFASNGHLPTAVFVLAAAVASVPAAWGQNVASGSVVVLPGIVGAVGGGSTVPGTTPIAAGSARLDNPFGVALDAAGNLYIADLANNQIEEVSATTGQIVVVAGGGNAVPSTTPSAATGAKLAYPGGIALDAAGNLYIADQDNSLVEKVTAPGTSGAQIVVIAGGGSTTPTTTSMSPAGAALSAPIDVAVDASGNLYIDDQNNSLVEKVTAPGTSGAQIVVVAGGGSTTPTTTSTSPTGARLFLPNGIALDAAGNLYIADLDNALIEKVTAPGVSGAQIVVVAGGGGTVPSAAPISPASAIIPGPGGVTLDAAGNLYIADLRNNLVEKVTAPGTANAQIVAVAGGGGTIPSTTPIAAASASINEPVGLAIDGAGDLYIADSDDGLVEKVSPFTTLPTTAVGASSSSQAILAQYPSADSISSITVPPAADGTQEFTVGAPACASGSCSVPVTFKPEYPGMRTGALTFQTSGGVLGTVGLYGTGLGPLGVQSPGSLAVVAGGGAGIPSATPVSPTAANLGTPVFVAADAAGDLYISSETTDLIEKVSAAGQLTLVAGGGGGAPSTTPAAAASVKLEPRGLAVDGAGNLYIADVENYEVEEVSATTGQIVVVAGGGGGTASTTPAAATSVGLEPIGLTVDAEGNLYIADQENHLIEKVTAPGTANAQIVAVAGGGSTAPSTTPEAATSARLGIPTCMAIDAEGSLYIADEQSGLVEKVTAPGTANAQIVVVAGGGSTAPSTTPEAATSAEFGLLVGMAIDGAGNLYVSDAENGLVEQISPAGQIAVIAGGGNTALTAAATTATNGTLLGPGGIAVDGAGNLYIAIAGDSSVAEDSPGLSAAGLGLNFPSTDVSEASSQQTVTLENIGNQDLDVTALAPDSSGNFNLSGSTTSCTTAPFTLAAGNTCDLGIVFQPAAAGSLTGSINITDNDLNVAGTVQPIPLSGIGVIVLLPPAAADSNATVAYDSTNNAIPLSLSGGAAASVAIATPASHGTATASGTSITYTPASGYSGQDSFTYTATNGAGTSAAATVTITVSSAPAATDFTFAPGTGSSATQTASPGGTASYSLTVTPVSGTTFANAVSFSVSGLPTGATAAFSPATLTAGSSGGTVTLTVTVPQTTAALGEGATNPGGRELPLALGLLVLPLAGAGRLKKRGRRLSGFFCLLLLLAGTIGAMTGCGSSKQSSTSTPQSYNLTVTATSGSVQHSTTLTLGVQ